MMMTQGRLPFQYQSEKNSSGLTGFAGLPLFIELIAKTGLVQAIENQLQLKSRGWTDEEMIVSLLLLNLAGGDCITDMERLEQDPGLRKLLLQLATYGMKRRQRRAYERRWRKLKKRGLPSTAAVHRYLAQFHHEEEESKREPGRAFIPAKNTALQALTELNQTLLTFAQHQRPQTQATLDQDATLVETKKRTAHHCYKKYKAYQPLNTYWAEPGLLVQSEFRDGNVPAGYQQLRQLEEALTALPPGITQVFLRSDSAGYQEALLTYCAEGKHPQFGVIEFAISAKVSAEFKRVVAELPASAWRPYVKRETEGSEFATEQQWAEVGFVPQWAATSKKQANYRFLAIREVLKPDKAGQLPEEEDLPFQTIEDQGTRYKLFGLVTNRDLEGNALIQWHRKRCGDSEHVHSEQKQGFAGGQLPSHRFGANAAWWQLMLLAFNLSRLMQLLALPDSLQNKRIKGLRFHVIQLPGRLIQHGRQLYLRVEKACHELYEFIRQRLDELVPVYPSCLQPPG